MKNTPFGTGLSCRPGPLFVLKASILLIFLASYVLAKAQTQVQWNQTGNNIYNPNSGNVGIGTQTPNAKLEVDGSLLFLPPSTGQFYFVNGITVDNTKSGIRCNTGGVILNGSGTTTNPGKVFFNRDVYADTWIESSADGVNDLEIATFKADGKIGFGTSAPNSRFEAALLSPLGTSAGSTAEMGRFSGALGDYGQLRFLFKRFSDGSNWLSASTRIQASTNTVDQGYLEFNPVSGPSGIALGTANIEVMRITQDGKMLIGKTTQTNSTYLLDVNGNTRMNQVVVNTTGADFVFDPGYHLPRLEEIETFIRKEHHLPGITPAASMQKDGIDLGDNQTRLLAKVEELTLYVIGQDKEIKKLRQENQDLQDIKQRLARLEQGLSNFASH